MTAEKTVLSATCCIQSGMQFFVAENGGKERKMSTNNETIKIIANGAEGHALCPVIIEIAQRVSDYYEEAAEISFDEETDFLIRGMVAKAYMSGEYEFAVSILLLVFQLTDMKTAVELLTLVAECRMEDSIRDFMGALFVKSRVFSDEDIS